MIKIIGIGGCGSAVNKGLSKEILNKCECILLGSRSYPVPKSENLGEIFSRLEGVSLTILVASLGCETGSKLALDIGNGLKELGLPAIAFTTLPFTLEDGIYMDRALAERLSEYLKNKVDYIKVFDSDDTLGIVPNAEDMLTSELLDVIDQQIISIIERIIERYGHKDTLSEVDTQDIGEMLTQGK